MHSTQNKDDEAVSLPGVSASSPARRSGQTVILSFQADRRRYLGLEDAMETEDTFEVLGSIAVRLLAEWKLPRIMALAQGRRGPSPAPATHDPWEG